MYPQARAGGGRRRDRRRLAHPSRRGVGGDRLRRRHPGKFGPRGAARQAEGNPLARGRDSQPRRRPTGAYLQPGPRRISRDAGGKCRRDGAGRARAERAMRAPRPYDAVLLLAFGGPGDKSEIRPFLARVLAGRPVPLERIEQVAHHYEALGGRSPLPDITHLQARALADVLKQLGLDVPVYVGFRHSAPYIPESLGKMAAEGVSRALGFILSSHRTEASWERYQQNVADARAGLVGAPAVDYCPGWHDHPWFIETWVDQIEDELEKIAMERRRDAAIIFTAHSTPTAMAERSPYVAEIEASCRLPPPGPGHVPWSLASQSPGRGRAPGGLGHVRWSLAYQSRGGGPREPWLEPDIGLTLRAAAGDGVKDVIVAPIGFVADHVEVLYDLDIEAKAIANELGVKFYRAVAPNDHPLFIRMIADVVEKQFLSAGDRSC